MDYKLIPQQEQECGRLFCSGCIKQWQKEHCPHCRGSPMYFPDTRSKCMLLLCTTDIMNVLMCMSTAGGREIKALRVRCNNDVRGCSWKGTVRTVQDHMAKCNFTLVPCPNACNNECILRKRLTCASE